ncbi:MAG: VWA domain-containing protein, partial [Thermoanaerobaculia bacterium]
MRRSALLLLSLLIPLPPSAAVAQGSADRPFVDVIDVRVVNLEVVVVDGKGNRVSGLGPEDFRLLVDKREVPIEFFNEVSHGVAVTRRPAESTSSVPGLVSGEEVGTSYLVFIDELFTRSTERNRVLKAMAPEVWRLGPEDRMAVVAFNGRRVDMLSTWSQEPRDLELAFEDAMTRKAHGLHTDAQIRGLEVDLLSGEDADDSFFDPIYAAGRLEEKLKRISRAVTSTLRGFAQPPGRKVMMLLAGGWPDSFRVSGDSGLDHARGRRILSPIYETANLLGYTLYPIDVPGPQPVHGRAALGLTDPGVDSFELEVHTTFDILAEETGGEALIDGARLTAFDRVIEDTRSYYWLGFVPDWQGDDKDHKIRIDVLQPGFKVRYRESFQDF